MADRGHELTDKLLAEMEKKIRLEYARAVRDTEQKLADYLRRFEIKDEAWQKNVAEGRRTEAEYKKWRVGQIAVGKRWTAMKDQLARDYHNANAIARSIVDGYRPEVYALNFNYGTYQVEMGAKVDTSFTLYDRQTVERIVRDDPDLLPGPGVRMEQTHRDFDAYKSGKDVDGLSDDQQKAFDRLIAANKDIRWQAGQLQSVMTQAILQGESIPNLSKRIARTMGETNHKSTIRYARTAVTGAQNAGRIDSYRRAADMGIDMVEEWRATLDMRTRHEHRQLDGQRQPVGEPFRVDGEEIMYPGDPTAAGHLIWNCRCTLRAVVTGLEPQARKLRSLSALDEGMSYDEWRESHEEKPHPITKQEEIAEAMRRRYIREYYKGD